MPCSWSTEPTIIALSLGRWSSPVCCANVVRLTVMDGNEACRSGVEISLMVTRRYTGPASVGKTPIQERDVCEFIAAPSRCDAEVGSEGRSSSACLGEEDSDGLPPEEWGGAIAGAFGPSLDGVDEDRR